MILNSSANAIRFRLQLQTSHDKQMTFVRTSIVTGAESNFSNALKTD